MRLIADRVLGTAAGSTYVDGELISLKLKALPPPKDEHKYHVCCSDRNPGALALMQELAEKRKFQLNVLGDGGQPQEEVLFVTTDIDCLIKCDHLLLYLTSQTWTRGDASKALAEEVQQAMDLGVHVLLAHESERPPPPNALVDASHEDVRLYARDERCELGSLFCSARRRAGGALWLRVWFVLLFRGRGDAGEAAQARHLLGDCGRAQRRAMARGKHDYACHGIGSEQGTGGGSS
jgi:hypothetical protein